MAQPSATLKGGQRMQKVLTEINGKIKNGSFAKVGYLENATYPDGTPVAQVAFWDEYGTKIAPPRPTFRPMIAAGKDRWGGEVGKLLKTGKYNGPMVLEIMGQRMAEELTESVVITPQLALSPVTLVLRKMKDEGIPLPITFADVLTARGRVAAGDRGATGTRAKPLIDTGVMQRAPSHEVVVK